MSLIDTLPILLTGFTSTLPTLLHYPTHSPPLSSHSPPFSSKLLPGSSPAPPRPPAGSGQPLNMSLPNSIPRCHSQTSLQSTFQTPTRDVTPKVAPACHSQVRSQVRSSMSLPNFISKCLSQTSLQSTFQTPFQSTFHVHSKLFQVGKGSAGGREGAGKEPEDVSSFAPTARFAP